MAKYGVHNFPNVGFYAVDFSEEELAPIREEVERIKADADAAIPMNAVLAGNIAKQYILTACRDYIEKLVMPFCIEYERQFGHVSEINPCVGGVDLVLDTPWVNFQRKTEFNPSHNHSGVFSFVLWLSVPYFIEDELAAAASPMGNTPVPGHFEFSFANALGALQQLYIPADKSYEGRMLIFPASLNHAVYPFFTSDDYRISVSGNFKLAAELRL